jgi:hypothetical protein
LSLLCSVPLKCQRAFPACLLLTHVQAALRVFPSSSSRLATEAIRMHAFAFNHCSSVFEVSFALLSSCCVLLLMQDGLLELPSVGKQTVSTRRTQPSFSVCHVYILIFSSTSTEQYLSHTHWETFATSAYRYLIFALFFFRTAKSHILSGGFFGSSAVLCCLS